MRLAIFFRPAPKRRASPKAEMLPLPRNWTVRDWADLPPFHPRHD